MTHVVVPIEAAKAKEQLAPKASNKKKQQSSSKMAIDSGATTQTPDFLHVSNAVVSSQPFAFVVGFVGAIAIVKAHKRDKTNALRKTGCCDAFG